MTFEFMRRDTDTQVQYHVMMEADTGGMQLQSKEYQKLERGKEAFCPTGFRGIMALLTPRFWIFSIYNCETTNLF